jgi:hypothetical protein
MCCIFCYNIPILIPKFPKTQARKGLIFIQYKKWLKKHVCTNHFILGKKCEEKMKNLIKEKQETQLTKTTSNIFVSPLGMHSLKHVNMLQ